MNNAQRNEHRAAWQRRLKGAEKRWAPKVKTALDHQVNMVVAYVKTEGLYAGKLNLSLIVPYEGLATVLRAMYVNAGLFQANVTWSELKRLEGQKYRGFGFNKEWTEAIIAYFRMHLLNKAVLPITENTREWIGEVLEKATVDGWGVDETVKEIMTKAKDINRKRARVITRTESVRAMNVATLIGSEKSSLVLDKQWIDAKDNRERKTHILCGKQKPIDVNDRFINGLAFPGDPEGPAKEVVNCRCSVAMVPRRDAQGRVIRKPKAVPVQDTRDSSLNRIAEQMTAQARQAQAEMMEAARPMPNINIRGVGSGVAERLKAIVAQEVQSLGITQDLDIQVGNAGLKGWAAAGVVFSNKPDSEGRLKFEPKVMVKWENEEQTKAFLRHELRHIYQSEQGQMYFKDGWFYWNGEKHISIKQYNAIIKGMTKGDREQYEEAIKKYRALPWESDADGYAGT